MAAYELTGTVKLIMDQQTFPSGFTKREFVVTSEERYPQDLKFECVKDRCALLDTLSVGDRVTVSFDIRGNAYNDRYFVNLSAWKIAPAGEADTRAGGASDDDGFPIMDDEEAETDPDIGVF